MSRTRWYIDGIIVRIFIQPEGHRVVQSSDQVFSKVLRREVNCSYLLYLPDGYAADGRNDYPLILFLHGAGERGSDLDLLKVTGLPRHIEEGLNLPFIIVCPQCSLNQTWDPRTLDELLGEIIERYKVDECRIYLTGLSMGGRGTWMLANEYPERFAAVAPICAPFTVLKLPNFKRIPIWCFHGAMDPVISIADTVKSVRLLRAAGCQVKFTVYADADHDSWTETYQNPELYEWFQANRKNQVE
jgi:predicted peptidase|tara:strand:+ start:492 stop:1223 length:732 start_codon:yes stop_codon:yes gene_type:complete